MTTESLGKTCRPIYMRLLHHNKAGLHFDWIASQNALSLPGVHTTFSTA